MTAIAATLFVVTALAGTTIIASTLLLYGRDALALRVALRSCRDETTLAWRISERAAASAVRPDPQVVTVAHRRRGPALPQTRRAASLPLAA